MNVETSDVPPRAKPAASRSPSPIATSTRRCAPPNDLDPWLSRQWREHMRPVRHRPRGMGMAQAGPAYPEKPAAMRRAATPIRRRAAARAAACRSCRRSISTPTTSCSASSTRSASGQGVANPDLSAALCRAINQWQVAEWTGKDSRLNGSDRRALRVRRCRGRRDPALGRAPTISSRCCCCSRTAEPLGNRRYWPIYQAAAEAGPAGRGARLRLWRRADHQQRLARLLHRGDDRPRPELPGRAASMVVEGRVRALPRAAGGHGRGRLRLGAVARLAARQGLEDAARPRRRISSALPSEYHARAMSGGPRSRWRSRNRASICSTRSNGWAGTGCCSRPTTRIGISTTRRRRCRCGSATTQRRQFFLEQRPRVYGVDACMSRHVVAPTSEIPPGGRKLFTVKGRPIAIFNLERRVLRHARTAARTRAAACATASRPACCNRASPASTAIRRKGEIIRCPWHGWEFDIRTGQSYCDPERIRTKAYPVADEARRRRGRRALRGGDHARCGSRKTTSWSTSERQLRAA